MQTDYKTLHEDGFLEDILNIMSNPEHNGFGFLRSVADKILGKNPNDFQVKHNIADAAKGLTATFPVIVTECTKLEHAVMVSKAIERKAIALLQMLFAANQITNATNARAYLRNFHHNIDTSIDLSDMGVDDVIEYTNKLTESMKPNNPEYQAMVNQAINFVYEDTRNNIHHVLDRKINPVSINEYTVYGSIKEAEVYGSNQTTTTTTYDGDPNSFFTRQNIEIKSTQNDTPNSGDVKNAYEMLNKGIIKTDVAKANEAVPNLMIVNFVSLVPGTDHKVVSTAVIGVKAVLHYVDSEDMMRHVKMKNDDNHGLLGLIKATTRETSFFKDFLFAVNKAKIDAIGRSGKGSNSKIWKILELRADKAKLNNAASRNNTDCAAITTIVLNQSEVDALKKYERIDLDRPGQLLGVMRGYNLMCGVIVDEVSEKVKFLFDDGDKNFETLSFMSLEREDGNGQLRKVINVMAAANKR